MTIKEVDFLSTIFGDNAVFEVCDVSCLARQQGANPFLKRSTNKVKVVQYTFVRKGVPVREDTYPEPSACEVGSPVP